MDSADLKALLKRVYELIMPDIRAYYRVVRKARVVRTYPSDGSYWADVQPLRNDESADVKEPVVRRVEIPVIWAGPKRGVICPPEVGTLCDLSYFDGDPDYPRISNFRWQGMSAPEIEVGGFIIQRQPGTLIKIDKDNNIFCETPTNMTETVGGDKTETVGGAWNVNVTGAAKISSAVSITAEAPVVNLGGATRSALHRFVDDRFLALFEAHTHKDIEPGLGDSGPPNETIVVADNCTDTTRGV